MKITLNLKKRCSHFQSKENLCENANKAKHLITITDEHGTSRLEPGLVSVRWCIGKELALEPQSSFGVSVFSFPFP